MIVGHTTIGGKFVMEPQSCFLTGHAPEEFDSPISIQADCLLPVHPRMDANMKTAGTQTRLGSQRGAFHRRLLQPERLLVDGAACRQDMRALDPTGLICQGNNGIRGDFNLPGELNREWRIVLCFVRTGVPEILIQNPTRSCQMNARLLIAIYYTLLRPKYKRHVAGQGQQDGYSEKTAQVAMKTRHGIAFLSAARVSLLWPLRKIETQEEASTQYRSGLRSLY